ncbi:MAG: agmatine/peptidylarginine deiminase [Lysobacterales bacterium]
MSEPAWRWPAEWEPQDAILLAWPHAGTDWAAHLPAVEQAYVGLIEAITRFEDVVLVVADADVEARARHCLQALPTARLHWVSAEYDDTWLRDCGPVVLTADDRFALLDFHSTGWGGKYACERDDALISELVRAGLFRNADRLRYPFALEGGAIDGDGAGSVLSTRHCLQHRHPGLNPDQLDARLRQLLHAQRLLLLESGELQGDDTDAHVDTLARFVSVDTIAFQACDDPADPQFAALAAMHEELRALRTADGQPYRLLALPWARPIHAANGRRLAASYANFLIVNAAVLVPAYGDPADALAEQVLAQAFPDRQAIGVNARPFIEQNGSLHCLSMQLPRGVVRALH